MKDLAVSFVESIADIGADTWNALAGTDNPFTRYEFLWSLEYTGCTTRKTGWQPHHVLVRRVTPSLDEPVAVMPLYLKSNSWGEYVFDWSWANAYEGHGLSYYPKFVTSAPFTPSYGKRLFISEGEAQELIIRRIKDAILERADFLQASSWHVLFPTEEQHTGFTEAGLLPRIACQFHWYNRDYNSFADFLATLSSRKRKNLNKERSRVAAAGITFRRVEGADISDTLWNEFYVFYQSTYMMRGMEGYLSRGFFKQLGSAMPEQLVMICAEQEGNTIATALYFKSGDTLYGRYWGSAQDYQFLHFETCFYQGQDYAIEHGYRRIDPGAQGEHKIQRGFEPILTYSNHWIANPAFSDAIADFLQQEEKHIRQYRQQAKSLLPYRKTA